MRIVLACLLFVFSVSSSHAWWSASILSNSTHHKLTDDARDLLNTSYADISEFGESLSNWTSGPTDDVNAHAGDALANGGPIEDWWDSALAEYKQGNFDSGDWSAYYYIGLMLHLTEDQGVPAHAYNIQHGADGFPMDNLEEYVYTNYSPTVSGIQLEANPGDNYADLMNATQNATSDISWRLYWNEGIPFGYYGGPGELDVFPRFSNYASDEEDGITRTVLGMAVDYTAGTLVSVSESLPPIIQNLEVSGTESCSGVLALNSQNSVLISFDILENRQNNVKVFISFNGEAISQEFSTGSSFVLSSGVDLPWEGTFSVSWNGTLSDGQMANDGQYMLSVQVEDADGNMSSVLERAILIDTSAPDIAFYGAVDGGSYASPVTVIWTVADSLDSNPSAYSNYPSGTTFDQSAQVNVSANDCAGNSNSQSLSFSVEEITTETCSSGCASSGACSWHDGVNCLAGPDVDGSVICNDGWLNSSVQYSCQ